MTSQSELYPYSIFVRGAPKGQPRPRFTRFGKAYTTGRILEWKDSLDEELLKCGFKFETRAIIVSMNFLFKKPKTNKKQAHTQKPDIDNLIKPVLDALVRNNIIEDDALVTQIVASKGWIENENEGVYITINYGNH